MILYIMTDVMTITVVPLIEDVYAGIGHELPIEFTIIESFNSFRVALRAVRYGGVDA